MEQKDKRILKGIKTKMTILETAIEIIFTEGLKNLTTRNIIEKSNVGKGSIYHHFDSLEDIVCEAIKIMTEDYIVTVKGIEYTNLEDFLKKLGYLSIDRAFEMMGDFSAGNGFGLWESMTKSPKYLELMLEGNEQVLNLFSNIISKNNSKIEKKVIKQISKFIYSNIGGLEIIMVMENDIKKCKEMWDFTTKLLINHINMIGKEEL